MKFIGQSVHFRISPRFSGQNNLCAKLMIFGGLFGTTNTRHP